LRKESVNYFSRKMKDAEKGIEKGREEGHEEGISLKEQDFTLKLWALQEFTIEKITLLVGVTEQQVADTIIAYLTTEQRISKEAALAVLAAYRKKNPAAYIVPDTLTPSARHTPWS